MKKTALPGFVAILAFSFMPSCGLVKDWHTFEDEMTCQQSVGGSADKEFKEGKCPARNAKGKARTTGYCQDAEDEDMRVYAYAPATNEDLKAQCSEILPGSSFKK